MSASDKAAAWFLSNRLMGWERTRAEVELPKIGKNPDPRLQHPTRFGSRVSPYVFVDEIRVGDLAQMGVPLERLPFAPNTLPCSAREEGMTGDVVDFNWAFGTAIGMLEYADSSRVSSSVRGWSDGVEGHDPRAAAGMGRPQRLRNKQGLARENRERENSKFVSAHLKMGFDASVREVGRFSDEGPEPHYVITIKEPDGTTAHADVYGTRAAAMRLSEQMLRNRIMVRLQQAGIRPSQSFIDSFMVRAHPRTGSRGVRSYVKRKRA